MRIELSKLYHNLHAVSLNGVSLYFSYETCVAFKSPGSRLTILDEYFYRTTSKHLGLIPRNAEPIKLASKDFAAALDQALQNTISEELT